MLISSIIGLDTRTTMDMDTTVRNINFNEKNIEKIILEICNIENDDGIQFEFK